MDSTIVAYAKGMRAVAPAANREQPPASGDQLFTIRMASDGKARDRASQLLQQRYAWRGYRTVTLPADQTGYSSTLSAHDGDRTIGTLTLELDGPSGLGADGAFHDIVERLRAQGQRPAEFTRLAVDPGVNSTQVLAALFHVGYIVSFCIRRYDTLLLEVNPRHVRFYERMLGCEVIGAERKHAGVDAPAVLLSARFQFIRDQIGTWGGRHAHNGRPPRSLYPFAFSKDEENGIRDRLVMAQRQRSTTLN